MRDGYGQTETTAQIGNPPGQPLKPGSMGGRSRAIASPCWTPRGRRPTKARSRSRSTPGPSASWPATSTTRRAASERLPRRLVSHRRRRPARRGGLHHLRRPLGRRVQELRLPHQPVRAGERADRAPAGGRGGGGAQRPTRCGSRVPKAFVMLRPGTRADRGRGARALPVRAPAAGPVQAGAADRVRRAAQDDLGKDPPGGAPQAGRGASPHRRARGGGVQGGGIPGASGNRLGPWLTAEP